MTTTTPTTDPTPITNPASEAAMTTTITPTTRPSTVTRSGRIRLPQVIRGEWIKFWTVRSTSITLLAGAVATVAFGMIFSLVAESGAEAPGPAAFLSDPVDLALGGIGITEMVVGVLGVIIVAGEYSTGLIRTAFAAVGRRWTVIAGKVAVLAASITGVMTVAVTAAVVAGQAVYGGGEPTVPVTEVLDVIAGTTVYLVGIGLIGVALGFILRSTAGGIGTLVGAVFIGPNLLQLLPDSMTDVFLEYLPSESGAAIMTRVSDPDLLDRGPAYVVFGAWVLGLLGLATVLVHRRDA